MAVWNEAPEAFWGYFGTVMANQPPEEKSWPTEAQLITFAEFTGIEVTDAMRSAIAESQYEDSLRRTTSKIEELALEGIPRVVVDGTVTYPGKNPQKMYDAIEEATTG